MRGGWGSPRSRMVFLVAAAPASWGQLHAWRITSHVGLGVGVWSRPSRPRHRSDPGSLVSLGSGSPGSGEEEVVPA
ncbi:hypothetical protein B0T11DRAFT_19070 [Plectosphaerella cucumerina]|uniref:Secreted protein n=1 Tax=Plectosphaerella cucumerina TaxID=40658 RepID=A0A8K0XA06_9PEZI|nr:hypothetical protein B0T11DRAFT_19070 [Plectosphaerella cucumerina]